MMMDPCIFTDGCKGSDVDAPSLFVNILCCAERLYESIAGDGATPRKATPKMRECGCDGAPEAS